MKEELRILKDKYIKAKTEAQKEQIDAEMQVLMDRNGLAFGNAMVELARETADRAEEYSMKVRLQEVLPAISISYIAKNYFNKTRQWFYQKLNGNIVNGQPAKFTQEEIKTLNEALKDVSQKIGSVQL